MRITLAQVAERRQHGLAYDGVAVQRAAHDPARGAPGQRRRAPGHRGASAAPGLPAVRGHQHAAAAPRPSVGDRGVGEARRRPAHRPVQGVDDGVAGDARCVRRRCPRAAGCRGPSAVGARCRSATRRSAAGSSPPGTASSRLPRAQPGLDVDHRAPPARSRPARRRSVVVSPCTTTTSGRVGSSTRSIAAQHPARDRVEARRRASSGRGRRRARCRRTSLTWSSISRCWPVTTTTGSKSGAAERATTGAILIASGRVP